MLAEKCGRNPWRAAVWVLLGAVAACGAPERQPPPAAPAAEEPADWASLLPYGAVPFDGILTGGQPSPAELEAVRDAGFETVINLRRPGERGTQGEAERVGELGMRYVSIPVAGADGLTEENARALAAALALASGPVLVHCGSSNRVGALFALKAFHLDGASPEQALEIGRAAGLTRLEGAVREKLGLAAGDGD